MLAKRIIPCLDVRNGRVVKGKKFKDIIDVDDPVTLAQYYSEHGADELVFYDITASSENRNIFIEVVSKVSEVIAIPFTVGGGVRTLEDFQKLMHAGADKISINSAAVYTPELITQAANKYGSQCVVLSMDIKKSNQDDYDVFVKGGREKTTLKALNWAKQAVALGAGELVINAIDTDGVKDGYAIDIMRTISDQVSVPVVASGGAGKMEHFLEAFKEGHASAALAASVFHFNEIKIDSLKAYLSKSGITVRSIS